MTVLASTIALAINVAYRLFDDTFFVLSSYELPINTEVLFLGKRYLAVDTDEVNKTEEFLTDFRTRMFFSYRDNIPELHRSSTDAWWGCSIRSMQMLVAQSMLDIYVGRDFRLNSGDVLGENQYYEIASNFMDVWGAVFSIQSIVNDYELKQDQYVASQWTSPNINAFIMKGLWEATKNTDIRILAYTPEGIARLEVEKAFNKSTKGVIVLLTTMIEKSNPGLKHAIQTLFNSEYFQGMVAADGLRAYYVPAVEDDFLYCMDPHIIQNAITSRDVLQERLTPQSRPYRMQWSRLHHQLTLGFVLRKDGSLDKFFNFLKQKSLKQIINVYRNRR